MTSTSQYLARVQNFVGLLYHFIQRLDTEGEWERSDTGWDNLHAQYFEHMAAIRREIQNGQALAAIVQEYAARQEDATAALTLLRLRAPTDLRLLLAAQSEGDDLLTQALQAQSDAHAILMDAARELRGDGKRGGKEGGQPPRP